MMSWRCSSRETEPGQFGMLTSELSTLVSHTNSQRTLNQQLIDAARIGDEDQVKIGKIYHFSICD